MSNQNWTVLAKYFSVPASNKVDPLLLSERGRAAAAMKKARALAKLYPAINIEQDAPGAWWVYCDGFDAEEGFDPMEGNHFCIDGREVLECVEVYVAHLQLAEPPSLYGPGALPHAADESLESSHYPEQ